MKIGVFIDLSNLYYSVVNQYGQKYRINFHKYMEYIRGFGDVTKAIAYGAEMKGQAHSFIKHLQAAGFSTKYKKPRVYQNGAVKANCDIEMAVDVLQILPEIDLLVLGSADSDFEPLIIQAIESNVRTIVIASGISSVLKQRAYKFVEIPKSFLTLKKEKVNASEGSKIR